MWIDDAGLLWHRLDEGVTVHAEHVDEVRESIQQLSNGEPVRAVVDISGVHFADRAAREAFSKPVDETNEVATAIVVRSAVARTMGALFVKLSRPARPVQLFFDEDEAARWVASVPVE